MSYTLEVETHYEAASGITTEECASCHETKLVQELPAEIVHDTSYCVYLCKSCLVELVAEFDTVQLELNLVSETRQ